MPSNVASKLALLTMVAASWLPGRALAETYTFSVEPNYTAERAAEVYQPLLDYLKQATGHDFKLQTAKNYHFYWSDLRADRLGDFVFDEPQFTDYRARRSGYVLLARTAENTSYRLVTQDNIPADAVQELVGSSIMAMPAPSLGFAVLLESFPNPMQQPDIRTTASSWLDCVEQVFSGDARAAMVPGYISDLYPNLMVVKQSSEFPGPAVSARPTVPEDIRNAVRDALLKIHEDQSAFQAMSELGITQFVTANRAEYDGVERMLRGFFGYSEAR
jgi:ABC-type phosphate/phosphonate transport system substrate-binding protein